MNSTSKTGKVSGREAYVHVPNGTYHAGSGLCREGLGKRRFLNAQGCTRNGVAFHKGFMFREPRLLLERGSLRTSSRYVIAVALLAVLAVAFGVFGTVAPPLAEEGAPVQPQQESSSESVGHFQNPPSYDSGWVDISSKCGQYVSLNHGLNTTDVVVDVSGKVSLDPVGGAIEWTRTYGGASLDYAHSMAQTSDSARDWALKDYLCKNYFNAFSQFDQIPSRIMEHYPT